MVIFDAVVEANGNWPHRVTSHAASVTLEQNSVLESNWQGNYGHGTMCSEGNNYTPELDVVVPNEILV